MILLDEATLDIFPGQEIAQSQLQHHSIIKLFNETGFDLANVTIPYSSSSIVSHIRGRTITPDGRIHPIRKEDIYDVTLHPGFIFYSDTRAKRFAFPAVCKDAILEYQYDVTVRGYTYWDQWLFQNVVPTRLSRFKVTAPAEWKFKWQCRHIDLQPETTPLPAGFKQTWLWQARDLPALVAEPAMPAWRDVQASLVMSPVGMQSWQDLAHWYYDLYKDRVQSDQAIAAFAKDLCALHKTDLEKLAGLYCFVRDEVRYVAVSIGIGGYQPHFSKDIFYHRYGDCKDKVILLQTLAACCGLEVRPVLISTQQNGSMDTTVVSHTHFNHVIARARLSDGQEIWMDPTSRFTPFGQLPWYDRGRMVFLVNNDCGGEWLTTPSTSSEENCLRRFWKFTLQDSALHGHSRWIFSGAYAEQLRRDWFDLRNCERQNWIERQIKIRFPGIRSVENKILEFADEEKPVTLMCDFVLAGDPFIWSWRRFSQFDLAGLFMEERLWPVQLMFPNTVSDSISVCGAFLDDCPGLSDSLQWQSPHVNWRMVRVQDKDRFSISRELVMQDTEISLEDYPEFYSILQKVAVEEDKAFNFK